MRPRRRRDEFAPGNPPVSGRMAVLFPHPRRRSVKRLLDASARSSPAPPSRPPALIFRAISQVHWLNHLLQNDRQTRRDEDRGIDYSSHLLIDPACNIAKSSGKGVVRYNAQTHFVGDQNDRALCG